MLESKEESMYQITGDNKTITKEKLSEHLRDNLGFSYSLCEEIVNSFFEELAHNTIENSAVTIKNFGRFFINNKDSRPGQNVKTGETVEISARSVLRFLPSRRLKQKLHERK